MKDSARVVVIGAGAAGLAAGRRLHDAGIDVLVIEARDRTGGRAHTCHVEGLPLDLGCEWLHSARRNPWVAIAEASGFKVDRRPPGWNRQDFDPAFTDDEAEALDAASDAYHARVEAASLQPDRPLAACLEPGNRWNGALEAVSCFYSGDSLDRISLADFRAYRDDGGNWRLPDGYGTVVATHGAPVPVALSARATGLDHRGRRLKIETDRGAIEANTAIVTLPSALLADGALRFTPDLPDKWQAAAGLPLGVADKLFLKLDAAEGLPANGHFMGRIDRADTASYLLRPFGRPFIEVFLGGDLARRLEREGEAALMAFAVEELALHLGHGIASRVRPIARSSWSTDPFARGSYSYAKPGHAGDRAVLAAPVDARIFFAGEACSAHDYSTAHGAYATGIAAADAAMEALKRHAA